MNDNKLLIYLDILGFAELAKQVSIVKGIEARKVRAEFIDVINDRIRMLEEKGRIIGKKYSESDDWLIVVDSIDKVFNCIAEILEHNTGFKDYEKIPLEIAVGTGDYDRWAKFSGVNLILENSTIEFLKTRIIDCYHKSYREIHNNQSPRSTFVVLTCSAYDYLEPLDKRIFQEIKSDCKRNNSSGKGLNTIFYLADVAEVCERGRMFDFLEKIGHAGNKWYKRVDTMYVPPKEYEDILNTLLENRIVFITGTQEYGKTYTAARIMWEHYLKGYEPKWIKGSELIERVRVREALENIAAEIKPRHIVYFEDPFGKQKYEKRETLERQIGVIIDIIQRTNDTYAIITSREEVFKEFLSEELSTEILTQFEIKLNIKKISYDNKKRRQMVVNWAQEENCNWLTSEKMTRFVVDSLSDLSVLPTPLCMRSFAVSSAAARTEVVLKRELQLKSEETAKAFAQEIRHMSQDKMTFLIFLLIVHNPRLEFFKKMYNKIIKKLGLKNPWEIDKIIDWFKWDKVAITDDYDGPHITLSHPSYYEAFDYLLTDDGHLTPININIIGRLLSILVKERRYIQDVARVVAADFGRLPDDVRNELLFKLYDRKEAAEYVAKTVAANFNILGHDARELLFKLSDREEGTEYVAEAVATNFDTLPDDARQLLFKLSDRKEAAKYVAKTVAANFNILDHDARQLLFKLSDSEEGAIHVAKATLVNYDNLPDSARTHLLLKLSAKKGAARSVASFLAANFDGIPYRVRNQLLFNLSDSEEGAEYVSKTIVTKFGVLPSGVRQLLFKLSDREDAAKYVSIMVGFNFTGLPEDLRNKLLLKLAEKEQAANYVAECLSANFYQIPEELRNELLFKCSASEGGARATAITLRDFYYRLPARLRNQLLLRLSSKKGAAKYVAECVASNFLDLPHNIQHLLLQLSEDPETAEEVAQALAANFATIPDSVRIQLLIKLSRKDRAIECVSKCLECNFEVIPENTRNELLLRLSHKRGAARHVIDTIVSNYGKLPETVTQVLFKLYEDSNTADYVVKAINANYDNLPDHVRNILPPARKW